MVLSQSSEFLPRILDDRRHGREIRDLNLWGLRVLVVEVKSHLDGASAVSDGLAVGLVAHVRASRERVEG